MELHTYPGGDFVCLAPGDGARLLLQYVSQPPPPASTEHQAALDVTRILGGFSLALQLVAAYLNETHSSLQSCLQQLLERQKHLPPASKSSPRRALVLSSTLALPHLETTCPRAVEIARMCACLAPAYIPEGLFSGAFPTQKQSAQDQPNSGKAIERLLAFSLLTRQQTTMTLSMHPLLQEALRNNLEPAEQELRLAQVARALYHHLRSAGTVNAAALPYYLAHIQQIAQQSELWTFTHLEAAALFSWGASIFYKQEAYKEAESLLQYALTIRERKLGRKHVSTAAIIHMLGNVKAIQGQYDEARDLLYEVTSIRSQILGSTHTDTLQSLTGLAAVLHAMNKSAEAAEIYQKAISLVEHAQGTDSPTILPLLEQLALLYTTVARFSEAEPLLHRACALADGLKEIEPQKSVELLHQFALVSMALEKWAQAEALLQRLASSWKTVQEQQQPFALTAQCQLIQVLIAQEQWEQAEALSLHILPIQQHILGPTHQETIQCQEQLAFLYAQQGRSDEAQSIIQHIQQIRETQAVETEQAEAIMGLVGQAGIYTGQQDFKRAEHLLEEALDRCLHLPHNDELAQATILHALAIAQAGLKHYPQAVASLQQALTIYERTLGPEHFDTQSVRQQYYLLTTLHHSGFEESG